MNRIIPIGLALVAVTWTIPGNAQAAPVGVRDQAKLFSPEAVQKADRALQQVERTSHWQVVIQTVDSLNGQSPEQAAAANAQAENIRGLYILIAKNEHKVRIEPSYSAERAFPRAKIEALTREITRAFKAREFDQGLATAVAEIQQDAAAVPNLAPIRPSSPAAGRVVVGVRDQAKLFSPEAVQKADRALQQVERTSHWQVVIQTVDSLNGQSPKEAAAANAQAENVRGLYILIAKNEHKVQIEPSYSAERAFPRAKIEALAREITRAFKAREFDQGLATAVAEIQQDAAAVPNLAPVRQSGRVVGAVPRNNGVVNGPRLPAPAGGAVQPKRGHGMGGLWVLVLLVIGAIVFFWILGKLFSRPRTPYGGPGYGPGGRPGYPPGQAGYPAGGQPGYGPGYPPPGYGAPPPQRSGGGFLSSMLGGLGGAVAGNILYDKFGHPHPEGGGPMPGGVVPPAGPVEGGGVPEPPPETYDPNAGATGDWGGDDAGTSAASSGTDAGGGGDWGGGDAGGGGDWGGGDAGGGGDGGGGGDW